MTLPTWNKAYVGLVVIGIVLCLYFCGCTASTAKPYDFPRPVDTSTRPITEQLKRSYPAPGGKVVIDNQFASARVSDLKWASPTETTISISPENAPINPSPWYAFRVVSTAPCTLSVTLDYGDAYHRYFPKLSSDGLNWTPIDSSLFVLGADTTSVSFQLPVAGDTLWVAGQEIWSSQQVEEWTNGLASKSSFVRKSSIGQSKLGRNLIWLDIHDGEPKQKPTIVLLGRQHPPEITGFLALHAFMDELLFSELSKQFFQEYRVLVYPQINPDGVDLGHWRHNAGGIDLNRDWAQYRQPEVAAVANHIVGVLRKDKNDIQLGMDFHSTWKDVYYTPDETVVLKKQQNFRPLWHARIERLIGNGFKVNDDPTPIGRPTSAAWFATQFGIPGITYEVGDSTPRPFIDQKARASAQAMMELLLGQ